MSGGSAFGNPGKDPRWAPSSKEGIGTSFSASSRVWFTLWHGALTEIHYPTVDKPQVRGVQFLITDGETFLHQEQCDLNCKTSHIEGQIPGYRIESGDPAGRYRLVKEIITDPSQPCVLIHSRFDPAAEWKGRLQLYVLLEPHLEVGGAGNSARSIRVLGKTLLLARKGTTHLAMTTNSGFLRTSCGYAGVSDGLRDLKENFKLDWQFECAEDGNIAVTGQVDIIRDPEFTIALAFGDSRTGALSALLQSLSLPFSHHRKRYIEQWSCVRPEPKIANSSGDGGQLYKISHSILLAHEDKTFTGGMVASLSNPWGEVKGDDDSGGYHLVWARDMVKGLTALLACGAAPKALRGLIYLASIQRQDGSIPQNCWIDGTRHLTGNQLDEVAFPIMLAWRLWKAGALEDFDPYPMVKAAAGNLVRQAPETQEERWENSSGYSPSTLAAIIAALVCAADFARARAEEKPAAFLSDFSDFLESHLEGWTVTTQGSLLPGVPRHYIRIHPVAPNDRSPDEDPNKGLLRIGHQPPGEPETFLAKDVVDAGFLELVRYGIRAAADPLIVDSLRVVDAVLKVNTPFGPCWRRYNHDGYGNRPDGKPLEKWGKGRAWPLLTGERGHYELWAGRDARPYIKAMEQFASQCGMLPEQIWDEPDRPEHGLYLGRSAGSAMPLMWAHAEYVNLLRSAADGQVFDLISVVADRYLRYRGRKDLEIWKATRQVRQVSRGHVLRVQASSSFRLHWTSDEWRTIQDNTSHDTGIGVEYVDIPVKQDQNAPIRFTFFWLGSQNWEGHDYEIAVRS